MSLEATHFRLNTRIAALFHETLIKLPCEAGRSGVIETGAPSFASVSRQCELRNDQNTATRIQHAEIHLALVIREDTQSKSLLGERTGFSFGIRAEYSEKDQQTPTDSPDYRSIHFHTGFFDTLQNRSHSLYPPVVRWARRGQY